MPAPSGVAPASSQGSTAEHVRPDVDFLKRRGRGRPGRVAEPLQVVAVRLTAEELNALDAAAAKHDMSRSEAIRFALAHFVG
ncbi:ribbon-helix-helix protein, CopG family [Pengzhenrongella sicca]|uniref:Ribbon-helix-helix protein, CopG family n=1 Tax=Pengzhenrongella sicca TaxID=2819238 RepID=A0A8A4ZJV1_9MICO|nr:ribbon-helix-helix protein, CopG family [Pengzhenrongella sicca]